ncbi:hypothetical protein PFISCL1PPCAC_17882 [Pristionchus fissidentatus]|uniref:P-type domain-containing protein n=1 Tax=Pristionchus fissidentatus TaxID=1538716 RepID=A0AAV5W486_9BILA|nr:hypothetical protein PFISCL1PPCAC_17882 [Pristionchus fissidentatus]
MRLLKILAIACLIALALARPDKENHRAQDVHPPYSPDPVHPFNPADYVKDVDSIMIMRCRVPEPHVWDGRCPDGHFCLPDDWRCFIDNMCETRGGWCWPLIEHRPPNLSMENMRKAIDDDSSTSDDL